MTEPERFARDARRRRARQIATALGLRLRSVDERDVVQLPTANLVELRGLMHQGHLSTEQASETRLLLAEAARNGELPKDESA